MKQHVNEVKKQFNRPFGNKAYIHWKFLKLRDYKIFSKILKK